jgi:hypothetical protein
MDAQLQDHEERIRSLEERHTSLAIALEKHLTWAETIWGEQQKTIARLESLIEKTTDTVSKVSQKLWMILGACSLAAASTGIVTWLLSK